MYKSLNLISYIKETTAPVAHNTINPAVATPRAKGGKAFFRGKSKKLAIKEPTHAPVVGRGIATNINKAKATAVCSFGFS